MKEYSSTSKKRLNILRILFGKEMRVVSGKPPLSPCPLHNRQYLWLVLTSHLAPPLKSPPDSLSFQMKQCCIQQSRKIVKHGTKMQMNILVTSGGSLTKFPGSNDRLRMAYACL
jgi:hypothetical protein